MRRLLLVLLPLLAVACGSSPPTVTSGIATNTLTILTPISVPETIPSPTSGVMCEMDTECFWQAYPQCPTSQRLVVLLAGPTLVHGDTVTQWRNILFHRTGGVCTIFVADQSSAVLSNGKAAGGPGPSYECTNMTREPSGALHLTGCTRGSMPSNDIDVPPHA